MAEKTVDSAQIAFVDRQLMLEQRFRQIDQVNEMMRSRSCMRKAISNYFQSPVCSQGPSLSVRILDWVFGSRDRAKQFRACCDHCDQAESKRRGMTGYITRILS
jgi:ATP-dependent DNA helicase RecQ